MNTYFPKIIHKKQNLDFNQLILKAHKNNKKIGLFEIKEKDWVDVGQMDKYKNYINKEI